MIKWAVTKWWFPITVQDLWLGLCSPKRALVASLSSELFIEILQQKIWRTHDSGLQGLHQFLIATTKRGSIILVSKVRACWHTNSFELRILELICETSVSCPATASEADIECFSISSSIRFPRWESIWPLSHLTLECLARRKIRRIVLRCSTKMFQKMILVLLANSAFISSSNQP